MWTQFVPTEATICDAAMFTGLLPVFLHGCGIKSASDLGMRLRQALFPGT